MHQEGKRLESAAAAAEARAAAAESAAQRARGAAEADAKSLVRDRPVLVQCMLSHLSMALLGRRSIQAVEAGCLKHAWPPPYVSTAPIHCAPAFIVAGGGGAAAQPHRRAGGSSPAAAAHPDDRSAAGRVVGEPAGGSRAGCCTLGCRGARQRGRYPAAGWLGVIGMSQPSLLSAGVVADTLELPASLSGPGAGGGCA